MTHELKTFLSDENILKLIDTYEFEKLYERANTLLASFSSISNLTETLLEIGIKPDDYMVTLPKNFLRHSNISSYSISSNITYIEKFAFRSCDKLESITIPNSVTHIGNDVFSFCIALTDVNIPDSVLSIGEYAFKRCALKNVTIGDGVTSIGQYAFNLCDALEEVTIGKNVKSIQEGAFLNCSKLSTINYKGSMEQWKSIEKEQPIFSRVTKVYCTDGKIVC